MSRRALPLTALLWCMAPAAGCKTGDAQTKAPTAAVAPNARAAFDRGTAHMEKGATAYADAAREYRAALAADPKLWEAHLNLGILAMRQGKLSEAAGSFERSVDIYPSAAALEALGEVYMRQGRAKKAVALYERALSSTPEDLLLRNRLAVALRHTGRLEEAEAEIRAILGRDAGNIDAYGTLAAIALDRDDLDLAELILSKGLARKPSDPRLLTNMGLVHLRRGNDQLAFDLFEKSSEVAPGFLEGRMNKAAVFLRAGDHAGANAEVTAVLSIEPGNIPALLSLGLAQRMAGQLEEAQTTWERLLALDKDFAPAHFNLGVLAMDFTEKPQKAKQHLERYLQLVDEEAPRAQAARERLELLTALEQG